MVQQQQEPQPQQLPAGAAVLRASSVAAATGAVEAIDFRQLYRQEKRKARAAARAARRQQQQQQQSGEHDDDDDDETSAAAGQKQPTESSATKNHDDGAADSDAMNGAVVLRRFPPWKLTGAPPPSFDHLPRLDRSGSSSNNTSCRRLSPIGIYYQRDFLASEHYQEYRDALWEWLSQLPINDSHSNSAAAAAAATQQQQQQEEEGQHAVGKWTVLPHARRRVALFDTQFQALPPPLQWLVDALVACGVFDGSDSTTTTTTTITDGGFLPNHILINEYTAAQGILPHTDGPAYASRTATLSLSRNRSSKRGSGGSSTSGVLLQFDPIRKNSDGKNDDNYDDRKKQHQHHDRHQVLLHGGGGGSLVVFEGAAYSEYRHSIAELMPDDDGDDREVIEVEERASGHCLNAAAGTAVARDDARISITVRHRFHNSHNNDSHDHQN